VMLEVTDNGRGMRQEMIDRFREAGVGVGVGLMSMHERARELGGKLEIDSSPAGASVRITLPLPPDCGVNRSTIA
jgi:signal transduction histidine kinase